MVIVKPAGKDQRLKKKKIKQWLETQKKTYQENKTTKKEPIQMDTSDPYILGSLMKCKIYRMG